MIKLPDNKVFLGLDPESFDRSVCPVCEDLHISNENCYLCSGEGFLEQIKFLIVQIDAAESNKLVFHQTGIGKEMVIYAGCIADKSFRNAKPIKES